MAFLKNNLEFYNKSGLRQSTNINSDLGYWKFELAFEPISTGLFATEQIHILENVLNIINSKSVRSLISPVTTDNQQLKFKFKDSNYENFFMYRIQYNSELQDYLVETVTNNKQGLNLQTSNNLTNNPVSPDLDEISPGIKKIQTEFILDLNSTTEVVDVNDLDTVEESFVNAEGIREVIQYNNNLDALTINLAFTSDLKGEFSEYLEIYLIEDGEDDVKIAEISLFAEAIAEDYRLTDILANFGQSLETEDSIVFRETEVLDDEIDHDVLNRKKKELILDFSNIIPYIGSYKGLIEALRFYGYSDLKIKEWWLNLETEKFFHYEIDKTTYKTLAPKKETFGSNNVMKRTGKFSLFYDVFKLTGEVDENGIPEIEPNFAYSQEEVLIKLYGLKTLLKNKYLPLNTRIVDITGQTIVFDRISTSSFTNSVNITSVNDYDLEVNLEIEPPVVLIDKDVYEKKERTKRTLLDLKNENLNTFSQIPLDELEQTFVYEDCPTRESYGQVTIKNLTFENTLADLDHLFEEFENVSLEFLESYPVYEIQYDIICTEGKGFNKRIIGIPSELKEFTVNVNVAGWYDIVVKMLDVYNNVLVKRIKNAFKVELPEPVFGAVWNETRSIERLSDLEPDFKIEDADFDTINGKLSTTTLEDLEAATLKALDPASYLNQKGLCNITKIPILELDRNEQWIKVSKDYSSKISEINKQTFATFLSDTLPSEILPKTILSTNDVDTITVETTEIPEVGDIVEIFEHETVNLGSTTIEKNKLTYSGGLEIKENSKFYIYDTEDVAFLKILNFSINRKDNETIFYVEDPDGLLEKSYSNAFIINESQSLEVTTINQLLPNRYEFTLSSSIEMNIDEITTKINDSKDMRCWWNITGGRYSIPIRSVETFEDHYKVNLIDNERELFRITKTFDFLVAEYDINHAETRLGKTEITIEDLENLTLEQIGDLEIDNCSWHGSNLPGFIIKNYTENGAFRIGDSKWFTFSSGCTGNIELATEELESSDIEELQVYDFIINEDLDQIHAVSKVYGEDVLSIIEFRNGLDIEPKINPRYACNYQLPITMNQEPNYTEGSINNRMKWNHLLSEWLWHDESFEVTKEKADSMLYIEDDLNGNFRRHFSYPMNGTLRCYNIKGSQDSVHINPGTIVGFYADASIDIIGKKSYTWKIIDDYTEEILGVTENEYFTYLFKDTGTFSIEVEITDWNDNKVELRKNGFINVTNINE
jgi:hypothetical protein